MAFCNNNNSLTRVDENVVLEYYAMENASNDILAQNKENSNEFINVTCNIGNNVIDSSTEPNIECPIGLPNASNYCYMNSVVQCLRFCPEFVYKLINYKYDNGPLLNEPSNTDEDDSKDDPNDSKSDKMNSIDKILILKLSNLISDLAYFENKVIRNSSEEFQKLHENYPDFAQGQQDADEYLQFLLNKINDVTKKKCVEKKKQSNKYSLKLCQQTKIVPSEHKLCFEEYKSNNNSIVTELFCGQMRNNLICQSCGHRKPSYQVFLVLSVPISDSDCSEISLINCLDRMSSWEKVNIEDCEKCSVKNNIFLQTSITKYPQYLIIHIKRFLNDDTSLINNTKVTVKINDIVNLGTQETKKFYELFGVVDHLGSLNSGHYFARLRDIKDPTVWWCLDDTLVTQVKDPTSDVVTGNTVLYFFELKRP